MQDLPCHCEWGTTVKRHGRTLSLSHRTLRPLGWSSYCIKTTDFRATTDYRNYTCQRHRALVMVIVEGNSGCTGQCLVLISTMTVSTSSKRIGKDEAKLMVIMSLCVPPPGGISVAFLEPCLVSQFAFCCEKQDCISSLITALFM